MVSWLGENPVMSPPPTPISYQCQPLSEPNQKPKGMEPVEEVFEGQLPRAQGKREKRTGLEGQKADDPAYSPSAQRPTPERS